MGTIRLFKVWLVTGLMVLSGGSIAFAQTNTFPSSGDVGIGTTGPSYLLDVNEDLGAGVQTVLRLSNAHTQAVTNGVGTRILFSGHTDASRDNGAIDVTSADTSSDHLYMAFWVRDDVNTLQERMHIQYNGNVGIGTTSPATLFHLKSTSPRLRLQATSQVGGELTGIEFADYLDTVHAKIIGNIFDDTPGNVRGILQFYTSRNGSTLTEAMRIDETGKVGIGTSSPSSKLHVAGDATIDGNIAAKYQDVAEWVQAKSSLPAGTVVVIDPLQGNGVLPASQAYDTRIAGVVSPQPGILLGEPGENKVKVAHSGRVKVKADARYGMIGVGDLLVTSPTSGDAMRSNPVDVNGVPMHRPGTIIGKALEPLTEGEGEILVLLTLQ